MMFNSYPGSGCVQAFVPHSLRKAPASVSHGKHRSRHRQTPLLPLRHLQIPRGGVSFLERGLCLFSISFCLSLNIHFRMNIHLFNWSQCSSNVSKLMQRLPVAVLGSVWTLAVIQQSDSISDDGDVRHGQPPRVSVLRRWLWAGQFIAEPYCCRSSHASTYCT